MMASMSAFTLNDTCIKLVGDAVPLFQVLFLRSLLAATLLLGLARVAGGLNFRMPRRDWWLIGWRSLAEVTAAYFFLTALLNMPIANVSAILQILPLTVTAGAALFLGESVGWRRLAAIAAGFLGMLLIVRPGPDGFNIYAGYALAAVVCVTARDLLVRRLSHAAGSMTVSFLTAVVVGVATGILSIGAGWEPVSTGAGALILISAILIVAAYLCSVAVIRIAEVSYTAPFRYTSLLVALVVGLVVFGDWPDPVTLTGAAVVVASGLFALYRERVRAET
ncbi:MAG: DMT family transporter [Marinibacterium sp.]